MENNCPILSICIPTFNRDYLIQECLTRISPIIAKHNLHIYISDNASSDNTERVVKNFQRKYSCITYKKQEFNIGPDRNFEYVLKMSRSKYSWLLGDGCYISEENITNLFKDLENNNWDLYIVSDAENRRIKGNSKIYTNATNLLENVGWHMTWLSSLIFNNNIINNMNYDRYYNSRFIQTGIIFEYYINHPCLVKVNPNIKIHSFNLEKRGHWLSVAFDVFCKDWYLFVMSLPIYYSIESKNKCIKEHGKKSNLFTLKGLLNLREKGYLNFHICCCLFYFIKQTIDINIYIIVLISLVPKKLISIAKYLFYKK